ncbi:MAG: DUF3524 domain-containing protein [Chromatocurvus sp.]
MNRSRRRSLVWLLSAYRADSHAAWADWLLTTQTQYLWRRLELPGRHFAWRIRGNPLSWLDSLPDELPDLIVATSMVDLATLKGLNPQLARVPTLYYFHENQFAYPPGKNQVRSLEPKMVQLYGALAADRLVFNSGFNRDTFLRGVSGLLKAMPDAVPKGVAARLAQASCVFPVAIDPVAGKPPGDRDARLVVWNHRWEHDKQPAMFADAMLRLADEGVPFRLALLGRRPKRVPEPLARLRAALPSQIVADGMLPRMAYRDLLARAAIVVSTSRHEFQGLSVLEAVSAGACPLVPDALCYPELYPAAYRYPAGDTEALVTRLRAWLTGALPAPVDVSLWYSDRLKPRWNGLLKEFA